MIEMFTPIPEGTICSNCKKRLATIKWTGYASSMEINHGALIEYWCKICASQAQIECRKEQAAQIPALEKELEELLKKESK